LFFWGGARYYVLRTKYKKQATSNKQLVTWSLVVPVFWVWVLGVGVVGWFDIGLVLGFNAPSFL
jgi:hypothetical protein